MPRPPPRHGTTNRWRTGCNCRRCTEAHNIDTRYWRWAKADERFPPKVRRRLLTLLRKGVRLGDAAAALGITVQMIHGRARFDPQWRQELDETLIAYRDPSLDHGRPGTYRWWGCRCPECREAHHPAG